MDQIKTFTASIYLRCGKAVRDLSDGRVISEDPVSLALSYTAGRADGILIFDQSEGEKEHEEHLRLIREICGKTALPVTGAGHIDTIEDVRRLLYAGCRRAALNFTRKANIDIAEEAAERFGRDRIAACIRSTDQAEGERGLILSCISMLILIDREAVRKANEIREVPCLLCLPEVSLDRILSFFSSDSVCGITGNAVNDNISGLKDLKAFLRGNGIAVRAGTATFSWNQIKLGPDGLLPVVVQEFSSGRVLMVAYMNEEAYNKTMETGIMTYWSRSRQSLWVKGETSGHFQYVKSLTLDCDLDTLLAKVDQIGAACHTGHHSCFFNTDLVLDEEAEISPQTILEKDMDIILERKAMPKEGSMTSSLYKQGLDAILDGLSHQSTELLLAAKNGRQDDVRDEIADLLYYVMVLMGEEKLQWNDITRELAVRARRPEHSQKG